MDKNFHVTRPRISSSSGLIDGISLMTIHRFASEFDGMEEFHHRLSHLCTVGENFGFCFSVALLPSPRLPRRDTWQYLLYCFWAVVKFLILIEKKSTL
jgi:hypothetical protein